MSDAIDRARKAADEWCEALAEIDEGEDREEVRQLLLAVMEATEQSQLGEDVCRAFDAFEGKATCPQGPHRGAVEQDLDRVTEAVDIFLRQRPNPSEGMECFPLSAIAKLREALSASNRAAHGEGREG